MYEHICPDDSEFIPQRIIDDDPGKRPVVPLGNIADP